ncbi:hypothetical protein FBU30_005672 [Linnemannia zychae]|nr:hypothetical protein FBU30_005672 [Linnemannia zychae]
MTEQDLKCNLLSCRSILCSTGKACVTTCSHIFCVECANKAFGTALVCPACETSLTHQDDIVFVDLNPSQEYRSSVLSGLRPEIVMEICTRAISFWTYQTSQEAIYQETMQKTLEGKIGQLEGQNQRMTREVNVELNGFRETVNNLQKDIEQEKRKSADLMDQLDERSRQLSKLQTIYYQQRRRPLFQDPAVQQYQQQNRIMIADDHQNNIYTGIGAIRGASYQPHQREDMATGLHIIQTQSAAPSFYTADQGKFVVNPSMLHPVHPTLGARPVNMQETLISANDARASQQSILAPASSAHGIGIDADNKY